MLEPSIDNLLEKIDSKYSLITIAARRARDLQEGESELIEESKAHTFVGVALEEIYAEKIKIKEAE